MYAQDSFFDLGPLGQVGLALLSLGLFGLVAGAVGRGCRDGPLWLRLVWALGLFWAFVWLSPQVYYLYYRFLIPDLPLQWVVKAPPGPWRLVELLTFQWRANLAAHGQGVMGWSLAALAVWRGRRAR